MKTKLTTLALITASCCYSQPSLAQPGITIATTTSSRDYPLTTEAPLVVPLTKNSYTVIVSPAGDSCSAEAAQKIRFNRPLPLNCEQETRFPLKIRFSGDYAFVFDPEAKTLLIKRQTKKSTSAFKRPLPQTDCNSYTPGTELTVKLHGSFPEGSWVKDAYSGQYAEVLNDTVTLTPATDSGGLLLLEASDAVAPTKADFNWRNANIYFVMVDRFNNANPQNDHSYGRLNDGKEEIGTFHGGDLAGITAKLEYIKSLGTDAIWLSPIVEQVHGFTGGGEKGSFPFYGYHGYWTKDFTKIDANFGTDAELRELITKAHKLGMKVLLDAVVNHAGYATLADLQTVLPTVMTPTKDWPKDWQHWQPNTGSETGQNWYSYNQHINFESPDWQQWWGGSWVRTGLPGYPKPGSTDLTLSLAGLPDFRTESTVHVTPPQWLLDNPGTRVKSRENFRVADYLVEWQADWVKRFGVDGFRIDTVKHVSGDVWQQLKQQASRNLQQWRKTHNNPDNTPFWMMGEVWGQGPARSYHADDGFDALINFELQKNIDKGAVCLNEMAQTYRYYADTLAQYGDHNMVSYISSHDTELYFNRFKSFAMQRGVANALLLTPGAVQVYYGDEIAREIGPYADDFHQGTRSDMVWQLDKPRQSLLQHWQKLGQFRQQHTAIGAGKHTELKQISGYAFSRELGKDKVVVVFGGKTVK